MATRPGVRPIPRIIVPLRNGGDRWVEVVRALQACVADPSGIVVIDSTSTDGSERIAADAGFTVKTIDPRDFNHGRTRQQAVDQFATDDEIVVFLTHDAVIDGPKSLIKLMSAFDDPRTGAAYGRQFPHSNARPFARHSASYLYPAEDSTRTLDDTERYGLRTTHLSNSFAAYRVSALRGCGGFPSNVILGEDAFVALRMLRMGWNIRYQSKASVRHSHDYTLFQEVQRYFDYGVFHAQLPDLTLDLGSAEGEGMRFMLSELRYMATSAPLQLPLVPIRNAAKYVGYKLGRGFRVLPNALRRSLSMTKGFWDSKPTGS